MPKKLGKKIYSFATVANIGTTTHSLENIANADCILVLDEGRVAERGTHGELLGAHGVYRGLVEGAILQKGLGKFDIAHLDFSQRFRNAFNVRKFFFKNYCFFSEERVQ